MGGWVRLKYSLCRCRCECEMCRCRINDLTKEETGNSILFILPDPLRSSDPFALLTPIRLLHQLGSFLLPCSARTSAFPRLPAALVLPRDCWLPWCFPWILLPSDVHPPGLQSHRRMLAPGLTERVIQFSIPVGEYRSGWPQLVA